MYLLFPKLKKTFGFTLLDMMVTTAIIITLSVVMVINFRAGKDKDDLRSAAYFVASVFHQAQANALAGKTIDTGDGKGPHAPYGYSVYLDTQSQQIIIFADLDGGGTLNQDQSECSPALGDPICPFGEKYILYDLYPRVSLSQEPQNRCVDTEGKVDNDGNPIVPCDIADVHYDYTIPYGNRRITMSSENVGSFCMVLVHEKLGNNGIVISSRAASGQIKVSDIKDVSGGCKDDI